MAEQMYGRLIYNSNAERDAAGREVEDFIQAWAGVMPLPYTPVTTDPSGIEYRNNFAEGTDSGPAILFSVTIPSADDDPANVEAHAMFDRINGAASGGSGGFVDPAPAAG